MATWITHLMIADRILEIHPDLHRRGFCVGSIAPDCNVENADWTEFTPSREVTHWMNGPRKIAADCDRFRSEFLLPRLQTAVSDEERAFLLGYYAHLIADAEFQRFIRDDERVRSVWRQIKSDHKLNEAAGGLPETWDSVKRLVPRDDRMREIGLIESEYLNSNPRSGYLTEILPLQSFPDYIDYLPPGSIVRKIGVMGSIPSIERETVRFFSITPDEYEAYVRRTVQLISQHIDNLNLIR